MSERTIREVMVEAISKYLCLRFGIEPIDSLDGSSNWWMFHNDVNAFLDSIEKRFLNNDTPATQADAKPNAQEKAMHFEKQERHDHQVELYITLGHAMIERCAQVAENFGKIIYPSGNAGEQFAAAIRKLKDAP